MLAASIAVAQEPASWKTGPAFRRQLDAIENVAWPDSVLRDGLVRLSQAYGVAVFLDRRIDPGQSVTLTVRDAPVEAFLKQLATAVHAEMATIGSVVYLGPPETASQLGTLAAIRRQDVSKLPNEAKARLLRTETWQWEELAQPRQLLSDLARQAAVTVENVDLVPLDLWPAVRLPPLPWVDRMSLLSAGFGLTFEINERGTSVRLVPAPTTAVLEKRYTPIGNAANFATQLRRVLPEAKIRVEPAQLVVAARQEDHEKIERLLLGQSDPKSKPVKRGGEELYYLKVENQPAGSVVRKMAETLGKEMKCDPLVVEKLKQPVNFNVEKVTLDYLMETTLKPLGLTYRLSEETLEIVERK
ncbi:MAG TPA: hypothetical protein VKH44_09670 [Pirellulaceae bacterium]|nr:hypothetical protein [Pirellulaceae bacterium]